MSDVSPSHLRGFLIPKKLTVDNFWTAQATYTQNGNLSGDPIPQQNSRLIVRSSGAQTIDSDISIISRRAGHVASGAAFTWKNNTTSDEFGQNSFNSPEKWNVIKWNDGSVGFQVPSKYPYPLDLGDGTCLIVCQETDSFRQIRCYKRSIDGTFTSSIVANNLSYGVLSEDNFPNLILMDDGSILCILLFEDSDSDLMQLQTYQSTDSGATWTRISRRALDVEIDIDSSSGYTISRMRSAQYGGQILLLIETVYNAAASHKNRLFQFCSIDGGGTFQKVTIDNLIDDYPIFGIDLWSDPTRGIFCLTYINNTDSARYVEIPHGFYDIQSLIAATQYTQITSATVAGGNLVLLTDGQSTSFRDESDNIYVIFEDVSTSDYLFMMVSTDGGKTFGFMNGRISSSLGQIYNLDDSGTLPQNIKAIPYSGAMILCCNWLATSTADNSSTMLFYGGFSNVNYPLQYFGARDDVANRAGFDFTYFPMDLPSNISSIIVSGAGTQTLHNSGKLQISTNTTQTLSYSVRRTPSATNIRITGKIALEAVSGGGITAPYTTGLRRIEIRSSNGSNSYDVEIRISPSQLQAFDNNAGSTVGSIKTIVGADGVELIYSIENGKFSLWYRQYNQGPQIFMEAFDSQSITDGGAATNTEVVFAHANPSSLGNLDTNIIYWFNGFERTCGLGLGTGFQSPDDLAAAPYPPRGSSKYVSDGVSITTLSGPAFEGDEYKIKTRYEYPIDNILYSISPTPRIVWRSQSVTSGSIPEQLIPIQLDVSSTSSNSLLQSDMMGIYLGNINFRQFNIEYYDTTAGSWQNLKSIDVSEGLTFNYEREGNTIRGVSGGTNEPYLFQNEFEGCVIELTIGGTIERYRISSHSAGKCGSNAYQRPIFELSGRPSGNGIARIIPKEITVISNLLGKKATAWAIRIPSNPSIDNYFQIGQLCFGEIVIPGNQYSFGRTITLESNIEEYQTQDRVRYAKSNSPSRRIVRIAWTEGVDISSLMGDAPTPDVWSGSTSGGAEKIATRNDTPYLIEGMIRYLEGAVNPLVYLPSIKRSESSPSDIQLINRRHNHILCTMDPEMSIENVLGDENLSIGGELFRVSTLNMIEII